MLPPSSGWLYIDCVDAEVVSLFPSTSAFTPSRLLPEDGGSMFLRNVTTHFNPTAFKPKRSPLNTGTDITWLDSQTLSMASLVNIVTDYGLDDEGIGVRSPAQAQIFPSSQYSYCLWVHLASNPARTGGSFSWFKPARAWGWPLAFIKCYISFYTSNPLRRHVNFL